MGLNFSIMENFKAYMVGCFLFVFVCFFFKISVIKIFLQRTIRMSTRFDPDQTQQNVGLYLGSIYLQKGNSCLL